jgi:Tol biopolymer transport system component
MHPDGSEARQLTFDEEDQEFVQWSPDGDEIMLLHYGDSHRIRIVDIVAGDFRDLPAPPGDVFSPQWIP